MIIRKSFKGECAHIVRNCFTKRCSENIHGHSFIVEVFLETDKLDNGFMAVDFGLLKPTLGKFVDLFDHTYMLWSEEKEEFKDFIKSNCSRWVELPVSPSAEALSIMFLYMFNVMLDALLRKKLNNGESKYLTVKAVRYHETTTGYAEATQQDLDMLPQDCFVNSILFSPELEEDLGKEIIGI